jgi:hypothetical protein
MKKRLAGWISESRNMRVMVKRLKIRAVWVATRISGLWGWKLVGGAAIVSGRMRVRKKRLGKEKSQPRVLKF